MIRGGDTPKQETLWAIEFESGKFAFGHANENQIFVATSGIGRQIWYADGNGFIAGSTESVDEVTGTIIDTYNEHFGTRISHLTPEAKTYNVGDIIKNWNAYEKIEIQNIKVKFNDGKFGEIRGNKFYIATSNGSNTIIAINESGVVATLNGEALTDQMKTNFVNGLRYFGYNVDETIAETLSLSVGDEIKGWDEYELIF